MDHSFSQLYSGCNDLQIWEPVHTDFLVVNREYSVFELTISLPDTRICVNFSPTLAPAGSERVEEG